MDDVLDHDLQDKILLEEMAQYGEDGDLLADGGGDRFSDNKNHDELMLQMEEFM